MSDELRELVASLDFPKIYADARQRMFRDMTGGFYDHHVAHVIAERIAAKLTAHPPIGDAGLLGANRGLLDTPRSHETNSAHLDRAAIINALLCHNIDAEEAGEIADQILAARPDHSGNGGEHAGEARAAA